MNNVGLTPPSPSPTFGSPNPFSTSAQPFTRSVLAHRSVMLCLAYRAAIVVPSLWRENTSAPVTNRFKSEISNRPSPNHRLDCRRVPLRQPQPLGVFIHDEHVPIPIAAAEQADGIMRKPVIQSGEPFDGPRVVEVLVNMHIAPERREKLAGGDVPIAIQPSPFLPARQPFEHLPILRIVERIVTDSRRNEPRIQFTPLAHRQHEPLPIPRVPDATGNPSRWRRIGQWCCSGPTG